MAVKIRRVVVVAMLPLLSACASVPVGAPASDAGTASATAIASPPAVAASTAATTTMSTPATTPAASGSAAASSSAPPSPLDPAFRVAAPLLIAPSGPGHDDPPPCHPTDVTATATTRQIQGGVAGVIRLVGRTCSLHIEAGPTSLLSSDGQTLQVPLLALPSVNPPQNVRPDLALYAGDALWGFTWNGSWCGQPAVAVVVPMGDGAYDGSPPHSYGDLHVPITGPQPTCHGHSDSTLGQGVAGYDQGSSPDDPAQPVLGPPPGWSNLQLSLSAAPTTGATTVSPISASLVNPTDHAVALSPCPAYVVVILAADKGSTGSSDSSSSEDVPCTPTTVVPAHGALTFTVPGLEFNQGLPHPYSSGSPVTLEVAIAGIPTAKATAHIG
jgi:hypothetical protein